jgi:hypothetical protein
MPNPECDILQEWCDYMNGPDIYFTPETGREYEVGRAAFLAGMSRGLELARAVYRDEPEDTPDA